MTPLSFPILTQLPSILALAIMTMACPRSLAHEIDETRPLSKRLPRKVQPRGYHET